MPSILYVWKSPYPWDVRADKICTSLAESGFDVTILARWTSGQKKEEKHKNFRIVRAGFEMPWKYSTPVSINPVWKNAIKETAVACKADLIVAREIMLATASAKTAKELGIPVIMDMAEHYPEAMRGWQKYTNNPIKNIIVHKLKIPDKIEKHSVAKMNGIITVCKEQNHRLENDYNYPEDNIQVVHNTPELTWFGGIRIGATNPPVVFAYHGYFSDDRNLENLIRAFIIAAKKVPAIKLILAGTGESEGLFHQIAEESEVKDRIIFLGEYKHSQIKEMYSEMDVGILPYKANTFINHTISNKLFDYLGAGKPVIVSLSPPMVRIIEETSTGLTVDCDNIEELANAIENIGKLDFDSIRNNGIKAVREKYNWGIDSKNLLNFIKRYIND